MPKDIVCHEHGTEYGDADLIAAICECVGWTREEFDALPIEEQRAEQRAWVEPMPMFAAKDGI